MNIFRGSGRFDVSEGFNEFQGRYQGVPVALQGAQESFRESLRVSELLHGIPRILSGILRKVRKIRGGLKNVSGA